MRREASFILGSFVLLAGCIQGAPDDVEAASVAVPVEPTSLLATPRVVSFPAGTSYAVVELRVLADDWIEVGGRPAIVISHEFPDVEIEATTVVVYEVGRDGQLDTRGAHAGPGGGGGGGVAFGEDPAPVRVLVAVGILNATSAFDLKLGTQEKWLDHEIEGEAAPAVVLERGEDPALSGYNEIATPFSVLFPFPMISYGMDVKDSRVQPPGPPGSVVGPGSLTMRYEHPTSRSALHFAFFWAFSWEGDRIGQWTGEVAIDDEVGNANGVYESHLNSPVMFASGPSHQRATGSVQLDAIAETFVGTIFSATTIPFDLGAHGMSLGSDIMVATGTLPVALETREGCLGPRGETQCHLVLREP